MDASSAMWATNQPLRTSSSSACATWAWTCWEAPALTLPTSSMSWQRSVAAGPETARLEQGLRLGVHRLEVGEAEVQRRVGALAYREELAAHRIQCAEHRSAEAFQHQQADLERKYAEGCERVRQEWVEAMDAILPPAPPPADESAGEAEALRCEIIELRAALLAAENRASLDGEPFHSPAPPTPGAGAREEAVRHAVAEVPVPDPVPGDRSPATGSDKALSCMGTPPHGMWGHAPRHRLATCRDQARRRRRCRTSTVNREKEA